MRLRYEVSILDPATHLVHVRLTCDPVPPGEWRWQLPTWTPGSYLIREYARHVDDVSATDGAGHALAVTKADKLTWCAHVPAEGPVVLAYTVYAHELTVRTSHLDSQQGLLNGASVFMYAVGHQHEAGTVQLALPGGWQAHTGLPRASAPTPPSAPTFQFADYDELVDCPFVLGTPQVERFDVDGVPHELVVAGGSRLDLPQVAGDLARLVPQAARVFGGLPYDRYLFLLLQTDQGGGGLEHRNSAVMMLPRFLPAGERRRRLLQLFAHEYFHAWNIKRLHPSVLGPFDYTQEAYTENLWLAEGGTDYYAALLPARAGLTGAPELLAHLARQLHQDRWRPGRLHQSLAEASRDAWIKFYRADAHSPNATVSYYARGALVSWLLDLTLRAATGGRATLDHLLRALWQQYPDGYPDEAPQALAAHLGGPALTSFFRDHVYRPGDLALEILATIGLQYEEPAPGPDAPPFTGLTTGVQEGRLMVTRVEASSPAERAGLAPGDELVGWDQFRVDPAHFADQVAAWQPGDRVAIHLARRGVLAQTTLELLAPRPDTGRLTPDPAAADAAQRRFQEWCGQPWPFPPPAAS